MNRLEKNIMDFYPLIMQGESETLISLFADEPLIDTPLYGEVRGNEAFMSLIHEQKMWLTAREARVEHFALTKTDERIVAEILLYFQHRGETMDLPVSLVADLHGEGVSSIRIYYSTWPLTGKHIIRAPIIKPVKGLEEPEIIREYMAGIAKPDKKAVLSLFAEEAYVREPSGSIYKHSGIDGLRKFYDMALDEGGVTLKHCTATFDGTRFAVEYICDEWGNVKFEPQAGMAVYELADPDHILAVRIYDDVTSPGENAA